MPPRPMRPILTTVEQSEQSLVYLFTEEEYRKWIATLKNNNAAVIDHVLVEQLKHLGHRAHRWLHSMLNTCFTENKIPKVWRQSRIIAILKPEKYDSIPKSHRPISLLYHTYKLYERLILNRITPIVSWLTHNQRASRLQPCKVIHQPTPEHHWTHRGWLPESHDYRSCIRWLVCSIWHS